MLYPIPFLAWIAATAPGQTQDRLCDGDPAKTSKQQLQPELDLPPWRACAADGSKGRRLDVIVWLAKLGAIEQIKEFGSELKREALERKILSGVKVDVEITWTDEVIPVLVAKRKGRGHCKSGRVDPLSSALSNSCKRIANLVGPLRSTSYVGNIAARGRIEREPRICVDNPTYIPVSQNYLDDPAGVGQEFLPLAEWKLIRRG